MKKIGAGKIVIAAALCAFAVATWFAFRAPSLSELPPPTTTSPSVTSPSSQTSSTLSVISSVVAVAQSKQPDNSPVPPIAITSPASGAQWSVGSENTISWSKAAHVTGQLYLVSATSGAAVGWIEQSIGPNQTYFPWNTRDLFLGETNPNSKNVVPGKYFIKLSFSSPNIPSAVSAPFFIVASGTP